MAAWYLGMFWLLYYILHSAFASEPVKRFFREVFPAIYPHYRAMYSTIAVVNFVLLAALHVRIPSHYLTEPGPLLQLLALISAFAGATVLAFALRKYGLSFFMRDNESDALITTGLNRYVRHPLYFGILLLLLALVCYKPSAKNVIFAVLSLIYLIVGTMLEERRLVERYGDAYIHYRQRTKMLIPYVL